VGVAVVAAAAIGVLTQVHWAPATATHPALGASANQTRHPSATAGVQQLSPSASLGAYVVGESAEEARAAGLDPSQDTFGDPGVAERSAPVAYDGGYVAVAAFGFDPHGQPVQVLSYAGGSWKVVAALAFPVDPGTAVSSDSLSLVGSTDDTADISVGYATGSAPDFLIPFAGAGCGRGPVVGDTSGAWQYLLFVYGGQTPSTEILGGDPRFDGGTLVSDNACAASVPQDQRVTSTWTYDPSSGDFTATEQTGWPPSP
jgi:hypothetical protein